jgi:hypothetical protein
VFSLLRGFTLGSGRLGGSVFTKKNASFPWFDTPYATFVGCCLPLDIHDMLSTDRCFYDYKIWGTLRQRILLVIQELGRAFDASIHLPI